MTNVYRDKFGKIETFDKNGMRYYHTPDGDFPSVTTVLGATSDKKWLKQWEDRVGKKEAERIKNRATNRGTALHDLFEKSLLGEDVKPGVLDHHRYLVLHKALHRITDVVALETGLYSKFLGVAGRTDAIAKFDGVLSVIDLKTSSAPKEESQIQDYFVQESVYGYMYAELLKSQDVSLFPKRIVTILVNDEDLEPQIFVKALSPDLVKQFKRRVDQFHQQHGV